MCPCSASDLLFVTGLGVSLDQLHWTRTCRELLSKASHRTCAQPQRLIMITAEYM